MKPLTLLFNTYPIAFDCPGGGEVQLLQYEKHLIEAGVRVLRYDPWNPREQFDQADIVHYFSVMGSSWLFCRHVSEVRKKPLIISPIVWIDKPEKYNLDEIRWLLGMARLILPNSQAECDQLQALTGFEPERFTPIVNGVDDIFFDTVSPQIFREHFGIHEPFVLCMGNIEQRKNQFRLIKALKGTGVRLVLAGQEREAEYAVQCRDIADETVHFIGMLEHGSILQRSAYAAAEALVLPSTLETPGLAALEAAATGTRLVVTSGGCTQEYFQDYAVYLEPYDEQSIRDAIQQALCRPKNPELPGFIRERYTWSRAAQQLLCVYRRLLNKSPCDDE